MKNGENSIMLTTSRIVTAIAIAIMIIFMVIIGKADAKTPIVDTIALDSFVMDTIFVEGKIESKEVKTPNTSTSEYSFFKKKKSDDELDLSPCTTSYRLYPEGRKLQLSYEHEVWLECDTVIATHWHQTMNGWYVKLKDGTDDFCDAVRERFKK